MIKVDKGHLLRAALEIGQSGENDALPYDIDAAFIKEQSDELADICIALFRDIESSKVEKPLHFTAAHCRRRGQRLAAFGLRIRAARQQ